MDPLPKSDPPAAALDPQAWRERMLTLIVGSTGGHRARAHELIDEIVAALTAERARAEAAELATHVETNAANGWKEEVLDLRTRLAAAERERDGAQRELKLTKELLEPLPQDAEMASKTNAQLVGIARFCGGGVPYVNHKLALNELRRRADERDAARRDKHAHAAQRLRDYGHSLSEAESPRVVKWPVILLQMIEREDAAAREAAGSPKEAQ